MISAKPKICARCGKSRLIKGHGLCSNCYNIKYWEWDHKRTTRTFAEFMSKGPSTDVKVAEKGKKPVHKKVKKEWNRARDRADEWFSRYIRLKYGIKTSDGELYCRCYTCGRLKHIKNVDNGHYLNRENMQTRFHVDNARPQCTHCNQFKSGRHTQFEQLLIAEVGQEQVDKLKTLAKIGIPVSTFQLRETAKYFNQKVKELQLKHNVKYW